MMHRRFRPPPRPRCQPPCPNVPRKQPAGQWSVSSRSPFTYRGGERGKLLLALVHVQFLVTPPSLISASGDWDFDSVQPDQAWLTVTPDPAVVEVNMAPAHDLT